MTEIYRTTGSMLNRWAFKMLYVYGYESKIITKLMNENKDIRHCHIGKVTFK